MTNQEFIESIRLEGEEWRDVVGWEGFYIISSFGRVASIRTEIYYNGRTRPRKVPRRLLKVQTTQMGKNLFYNSVCLYEHHKCFPVRVHVLVAKAFLPNPNGYKYIDHIDGNGTNNHVKNLRWCSASQNNMNPITRRRNSDAQRGRVGSGRDTPVACVKKNGTVEVYKSIILASKSSGKNRNTIAESCSGKTTTCRDGSRWMYLSDYENLVSMSKNSSTPMND